ncbi:DUF1659 domain-containing protein [Aquibacillus sp. 3ASR75-11]|uniref:DUF1659 domain-containing protein n=1 Tax=Terrihalobacillus insolitus TaxID=2950438 RepID=A0A9X3WTW4_9BACI|nr:DUF1659 domain-containing protein [Terrihalobacillus insolitus]MDC3411986.1 DUF1659 domain-containing protein [Terrihalobacillus insolitus]MDC3423329.1 DUF1659 domain-containing protein [Terrihalobacillus insolitus]
MIPVAACIAGWCGFNTILKTKSFNNVKTAATAIQLFVITNALVPLQQRPLQSIERDNDSVIT